MNYRSENCYFVLVEKLEIGYHRNVACMTLFVDYGIEIGFYLSKKNV